MRSDTKCSGAAMCARQYTETPEFNHAGLPDEALIEHFVMARDEEALSEIVSRYADKIYRIALKITRDPADAEEVLQEVFVILVGKAGTFRKESKFSTWLYRVAMNAGYMHLRANKKQHTNETSIEDYAPWDETGMLRDAALKDFSRRPDRELLSREGLELIRDSINQLPVSYRMVFHLKHEEGLSDMETAETLGLSLSAVKSRIHRARLFLRDKLADYYFEMGK